MKAESKGTSLIIADFDLAEAIAYASHELRSKEVVVTKRAIQMRKAKAQSSQKHFDRYGVWPGGWDAIHDIEKEAGDLAVQAEHVELTVMIQEQWLNKGWRAETWKSEITSYLESRDGKDYQDKRDYYDEGMGSSEKRKEYWKEREPAVVGKMLRYIDRREFDLREEKRLIDDLATFGEQLRIGATPDPKGTSAEASATLVLLYQARLSVG